MALSRALKPHHVFGNNKQTLVRGDNFNKESVDGILPIAFIILNIVIDNYNYELVKESTTKPEPDNEEQVSQEVPEENILYEVDEPIILLDPRGNMYLL